MPLSLAQLLLEETEEQALNYLLEVLRVLGFNTTAWQSNTRQRILLQGFARHIAKTSKVIPKIARGLLLGLSTGEWLDLLGAYFFQAPRQEAIAAVHTYFFSASVSAPVSTNVAAGARVSDGTRTFTVLLPVTVAAGASNVAAQVRAVIPGVDGNRAPGTITTLVTPYPGLTGTNPAGVDGTSLYTPGIDREKDDKYTTRLGLQWSTLGANPGTRYYELLALSVQDVTRAYCQVGNPDGPNTFRLYLANATGPATVGQVAAVSALLTETRRGINHAPSVLAATTLSKAYHLAPVITVGGVSAAEVLQVIYDYLGAVPIGGYRMPDALVGKVLRDPLIGQLMLLPGMINPGLTQPPGDYTLTASQVVAPLFEFEEVTYV